MPQRNILKATTFSWRKNKVLFLHFSSCCENVDCTFALCVLSTLQKIVMVPALLPKHYLYLSTYLEHHSYNQRNPCAIASLLRNANQVVQILQRPILSNYLLMLLRRLQLARDMTILSLKKFEKYFLQNLLYFTWPIENLFYFARNYAQSLLTILEKTLWTLPSLLIRFVSYFNTNFYFIHNVKALKQFHYFHPLELCIFFWRLYLWRNM